MKEQKTEAPVFDKAYSAFQEEETAHYDKLAELARNSGFYVECDEDMTPLNDDGSAKKEKGEKSGDLKVF